MKQQQASNDVIKWEFSNVLMETGDADYIYGPTIIAATNRAIISHLLPRRTYYK